MNCEQETFPNIVDKIVHDFVDSGHMNKENREMMRRTLMSDHRACNSFGVSGLTRKKSTMSEFFPPPIGSRRQSTFTGDVPTHYSSTNNNSENVSVNTSRKNSYAQFESGNGAGGGNGSGTGVAAANNPPSSSSSTSKTAKDKKLSMSEFNLQNKVSFLFVLIAITIKMIQNVYLLFLV